MDSLGQGQLIPLKENCILVYFAPKVLLHAEVDFFVLEMSARGNVTFGKVNLIAVELKME